MCGLLIISNTSVPDILRTGTKIFQEVDDFRFVGMLSFDWNVCSERNPVIWVHPLKLIIVAGDEV